MSVGRYVGRSGMWVGRLVGGYVCRRVDVHK